MQVYQGVPIQTHKLGIELLSLSGGWTTIYPPLDLRTKGGGGGSTQEPVEDIGQLVRKCF